MKARIESLAQKHVGIDIVNQVCSAYAVPYSQVVRLAPSSRVRILSSPVRNLEIEMNNFILSSKADISKLTAKPLRLLVWCLGSFLSDAISGYIVLNSMIGGNSKLLDLTVDVERDALIRFIVIKRPRADNLLDWMIKQQNRDYALAAKLVLEESLKRESGARGEPVNRSIKDLEVEAIASLFRVLLLPNLNIQEALFEVREEAREYTARLIGAQLGLSELRQR